MAKMLTVTMALAVGLLGCDAAEESEGSNPFLQDQSNSGKADTAYLNPDGVEVEVDLEGDVEGPAWRLLDGPAELGQYALTYLRNRGQVYLESLAEDSTSDDRAEWLVNGKWVTADQAKQSSATLRHFRLRGVNAVLLFSAKKNAIVGQVIKARVPLRPFSTMTDLGSSCADPDSHIGLDASVYWYLWNPDRSGCKAVTQDLTITISKKLAAGTKAVYPEYDQLVADKKVTAVVLFGQIGDGAISENDIGMIGMQQMASWLQQAGFSEVSVSLGRRFSKTAKTGVTFEIDLYSPHEFSGLGDFGHFANFQKALSEHEIVVYDGHSMLGASDFWARPSYPSFYQIYLYGGCLGYEYYVRPILAGKKGWQNVDILSSVVEVSVGANEFAGPFLAKLLWALDNGYRASWRDMLVAIRSRVGDSTFGVSGVRGNKFVPTR